MAHKPPSSLRREGMNSLLSTQLEMDHNPIEVYDLDVEVKLQAKVFE